MKQQQYSLYWIKEELKEIEAATRKKSEKTDAACIETLMKSSPKSMQIIVTTRDDALKANKLHNVHKRSVDENQISLTITGDIS